jgi:subtilisin family serine protease
MSLGGGRSTSLNTAANNLATSGVFLAVAAGNENQNACNVSPASAAAAYTTAASDRTDPGRGELDQHQRDGRRRPLEPERDAEPPAEQADPLGTAPA